MRYTAKLVAGKLEGTGEVDFGGGAPAAPGGAAGGGPEPFTAVKAE